jgi:asparagine synthase (glutamine-hydrolysing)
LEQELPEVAWRRKIPVEFGSGTCILASLSEEVSNREFEEERRRVKEGDGVILREKEQLIYYRVYRSEVGVPRAKGGRACPYCNSDVADVASYCRTCGAYPI